MHKCSAQRGQKVSLDPIEVKLQLSAALWVLGSLEKHLVLLIVDPILALGPF